MKVIVVPLSTVRNWQMELEKFSPQLQVLVYHGTKDKRMEIRKNIIEKVVQQSNLEEPTLEFHVLLSTYDIVMQDVEFISNFKWKYLIIDEGNRWLDLLT